MTEADWRMKAMADFFGAKFVRLDEDGEPMTTNDATTRERITATWWEGGSDKESADATIRMLWSMADDPAVVDAMYAASVNGVFGEDADLSLTGREIVHRAFKAGLTALLGPRPQGGDDGH